jgi:hypothetical protein
MHPQEVERSRQDVRYFEYCIIESNQCISAVAAGVGRYLKLELQVDEGTFIPAVSDLLMPQILA